VSDDQTFFATCSNDGTVKMWDCNRFDGRIATNRSRYTYNKQGGQIKTITFCESAQSIAAASDSGAIHVFRSAPSGARTNLKVGSTDLALQKIFFCSAPSLFGSKSTILVVLVSAFVMVSTVWSVSCLLFFYSQCPPRPGICKSGGHVPPRTPWNRRHCRHRI